MKYTDEIENTCKEIIYPITQGIAKMTKLAQQKGCSEIGYYIESTIMEEMLELLD